MKNCLLPILITILLGCQKGPAAPPDPVGPLPTQQQLEWQELEFYAFVHFNMNTFTNKEWGFGDESPELFNPAGLDCRQWARVCKNAGMKGIILTAKHHDGFCLWPSAYTEHSVKNSPWKDGAGDVMRELAQACREYDLKLGIYYSPWDRNHPSYGKPEYINYMRSQLGELLTNYGEIFEVWFDGANGGTGYYGGANEERRVDKKTYYDWKDTYQIVRKLQPNALMFSDAGPDVRWVGNEDGHAFETMWSPLMRDSIYPGMAEYAQRYAQGQENGTHWVPGETNVSIRPGWFYHEHEDLKVKPVPALVDMYYNSIGRNTTWLLNFPVDRRGLIHENDVARLQKMTEVIATHFKHDLARGKKIKTSNSRGSNFGGENVLDGKKETYWAAEDGETEISLTIDFEKPTTFNRFLMQEYIALGQRIKAFNLEIKTKNGWEKIAAATTVGYKRILRFPAVTATVMRVNIADAKACPAVSNIEIYYAPKLLLPPTINRNENAEVVITAPEDAVEIYYTKDGSVPTPSSLKYNGPFLQKEPAIIKAIVYDARSGGKSGVGQASFNISKTGWKVLHKDENAQKAIDGIKETWWANENKKPGSKLIIDMGENKTVIGFTYLPVQGQEASGLIKKYEFYVSFDNRIWTRVSKGRFANIEEDPVLQQIEFDKISARYIKLVAIETADGNPATYAEVGVLTEE